MSRLRAKKGRRGGRRNYEEIEEAAGGDHRASVEDALKEVDNKDSNNEGVAVGRDGGGRLWTWSSFIGGFAVGFITRGNVQPSPQAGRYRITS